MNKVKIITEINPVCYSACEIERVIMESNVISLDMGLCSYDFCTHIIKLVRKINIKQKMATGIMINIRGLEFRTGQIKEGTILVKGDRIRIYKENIIGDRYHFSVNHFNILMGLKDGIIKLSDGKVILEVVGGGEDYIIFEVTKGGLIESYSKIYIPNFKITSDFLSAKDREDILFACKMKVDFLGIFNVACYQNILEVSDLIIELGNNGISLVVWIGNDCALREIDRILRLCEGVVVFRDELDIYFSLGAIPLIKKHIIDRCLFYNKVSIVPVSVDNGLNSLVVSDIFSIESDAMIICANSCIIRQIKGVTGNITQRNNLFQVDGVNKAICYNAVILSDVIGVKAIIVLCNTGYSARLISNLKPNCPIIAFCFSDLVIRSLMLYFNLFSFKLDSREVNTLQLKVTVQSRK